MNGHPGDILSALLDGELDAVEAARVHEHLDIGFLTHRGGEAQDRHGGRGQPGQAPPEHIPDAFGDLGDGDQR